LKCRRRNNKEDAARNQDDYSNDNQGNLHGLGLIKSTLFSVLLTYKNATLRSVTEIETIGLRQFSSLVGTTDDARQLAALIIDVA